MAEYSQLRNDKRPSKKPKGNKKINAKTAPKQ